MLLLFFFHTCLIAFNLMIINELESGILYASVHFDYLTSFSMRCVSLTVYPAVSHHMRIYACVCVCVGVRQLSLFTLDLLLSISICANALH